MKRTLIISILILSLIFTLCACSLPFGDNSSDGSAGNGGQSGGEQSGNNGNDNNGATGGYDWIVVDDITLDVVDIRAKIMDLHGIISTVTDAEPAKSREIVLGDADRAVTVAAKAALAEKIKLDPYSDIGYIIYSDGKSVAVYWTEASMSTVAIADFVRICIDEKQLVLESGVLHTALFNASEYAAEGDWLALQAKCDPELYNALRKLSNYYDGDKLYAWLANLWDGDIGGFYFSISARDNEPFLPDLESTRQALRWLENNNLIDDCNDIPGDIKIKLVDFAKSLQSTEDGYFYHPQWPQGKENLKVDRYGRDLSWAMDIINSLTVDRDGDGVEEVQYPNVCSPEGTKCEIHANNGGVCSFISVAVSKASAGVSSSSSVALTVSMLESTGSAVSRLDGSFVTPVASTDRPDYSSREAFRTWLIETNKNMGESSGNAHNINAQSDIIIAYGYCDVLLDFLDEKQQEIYDTQLSRGETPSGLWKYYPSYNAVWGLLKYAAFYNDKTYGREIKYAEEIVATCLATIMLPADENYQANDIYNQWQGLNNLFNNVKKYNSKKLESLYEMVREDGAALVENSIEKLKAFKRDDGGFSMYVTGLSPATMYGTPTALSVMESDVNATSLCCSMYRCMFTCFGYSIVHLCDPSDGEKFIEILYEAEPIVKKPEAKPKTYHFDDESDFIAAKLESQSGSASISIVDDNDLEYGNQVLQFNSMPAYSSTYGDGVRFSVGGPSGANCVVFESDICVKSNVNNDEIMQIRIDNFYRILIRRQGTNNLKLIEQIEGKGDISPTTLTTALKVGEWFKLRVECYKPETSGALPYFKVFINNEYITTTNGAWGINTALSTTCANIYFRSLRTAQNEILIDNCFFYNITKEYDPNYHDTVDVRG